MIWRIDRHSMSVEAKGIRGGLRAVTAVGRRQGGVMRSPVSKATRVPEN
jgi:hypothetical protein